MERLHLLALGAIIGLLAFAASGHKSLTNQSRHEIRHLYVAGSNDTRWSGDQLQGEALLRGDSVILSNIRCGASYFIKAVDEGGRQFVVRQTNVCGTESDWAITDELLLASSEPVRLTRAAPRPGRESGSR